MAPSNPVRIVDADGNLITLANPLPVNAEITAEIAGLATEAKQDAEVQTTLVT